MKIYKTLIAAISFGALVLSGCSEIDDFLNEEPSKNTLQAIETVDQLDAVLASYAVYPVHFFEEKPDMLYSTDDFGYLMNIHDQKPYSTFMFYYGLWNNENDVDDRYPTWNGEYTKVFYANLVLDNLDKVKGDEKQKALLKADASFLRAYCFFTIALAHTLYYDGTNGDELGITLKKSTSFEEDITRANLKDTWDF
ncbi:MAG: RagB/SusD family nutrient uptake outer membrane protein, partial [Bacteroidales bacterium]|nr:RagB/SusD family nutrient uptake outer membrane protein [Bacteroidales bacterium]